MSAILIGCAHGTRADAGQQTIRDLLDELRGAMGIEVREAYVDVQDPKIDAAIGEVAPREDGVAAVVVPILLAGGYHVHVDIAEAVEHRSDIRSAPALGPDPRLLQIVLERLGHERVPHDATVVLAAAGSSDPRSQADTEQAAEMLREHWDGPVRIGFAAGTKPSVADAVATARAHGDAGTVAVASYLLSPGLFQRRLHEAGADIVTAPLAPHPLLLDIIADRFRDALA